MDRGWMARVDGAPWVDVMFVWGSMGWWVSTCGWGSMGKFNWVEGHSLGCWSLRSEFVWTDLAYFSTRFVRNFSRQVYSSNSVRFFLIATANGVTYIVKVSSCCYSKS